MSWNAFALVVEPPLPVANTLLDEARRLAARLDEAGGSGRSEGGPWAGVTWARPHRYAAPMALTGPLTSGDDEAIAMLDPIIRATETLVRGREEFAVQMGPIGLQPCGDGALIVSRLVSAHPEDLASFLEETGRHLADLGMVAVDAPMVRVNLGRVRGEGCDAVRSAIEPKETPIAGWLLGGVCLARAMVDPEVGLLEAERIRFLPLKRLGARR